MKKDHLRLLPPAGAAAPAPGWHGDAERAVPVTVEPRRPTLVVDVAAVTLRAVASPGPSPRRRRGQLYDSLLAGLQDYVLEHEPELTVEQAAALVEEFPTFLAGLKTTMRGDGRIRDMPDLSGHTARPR